MANVYVDNNGDVVTINGNAINAVVNNMAKYINGTTTELVPEDFQPYDAQGRKRVVANAFYNNIKLTSIDFGNSSFFFQLNTECFSGCSSLTSITFGTGSFTLANDNCFTGCNALQNIVIKGTLTGSSSGGIKNNYSANFTATYKGDGVTTTGQLSFYKGNYYSSAGLTRVVFDDVPNLTTIDSWSFGSCTKLSQVDPIPATVTQVKYGAFNGCSALTSLTFLSSTPPTLEDASAISTATTTIYVPAGCKSAYESATNWADLTTRATNPVTFVELS